MNRTIRFFFLLVAWLMPFAIVAQSNHWTPQGSAFEDNMTLTGVIQINGVEQQSTALEVGAFCGTQCRGSVRAVLFPPTQRYVVQLTIFGVDGDQITFKLYDHNQGLELDVQSPDAVTFGPNGIGTLVNPYVLSFMQICSISASANPSEGGTVSGAGSYNHGSTCTLTAVAAEGYNFVNWTENGEVVSTDAEYTFTVMGGRDLVANFDEVNTGCNIVFELKDSYGDGWNGNYLVVSYGDVTEQFTMESGSYASYSLDITTGTVVSLSWISGSWMQECSFDIKFGNGVLFYHGADLSASFQEELTIDCELASAPYLISATSDPSEGGFVEGGGVYEGGTTCTLTATANTGYTFMYWTENGIQVSSDATYSFTVPGNRDLVAHFSLPLTITASSNPIEGGSVTGAGIYDYGTTCTLTATPNTDYTFIYWKKDGQQVSTDATYSFTVTENLYLEACFSLPFYVAVSSNSLEGGSVAGGGIYNYGTTCTLTATANPGYTFIKWTKYGRDVSYFSPLDLHVSATESGDYVAVFEKTKGIVVGMPQTTNQFLPSYSNCKYSLSQQIYTPDEIGGSTPITGLSFFNTGGEKTRNYDIYLVHTDKTVFSSDTDWIAVTESDRVFSGDVVMTSGYWTTIAFDTPFVYDGTSNLSVVIDDNTGSYSSGMSCRAFNAQGTQAIRVCSDGNNYDPFNLSGYGGQRYSKKNQIVFKTSNNYYTITATANPTEGGSVSGSGSYCEYTTCTLTATADSGYTFIKWVKNGEVVSYLSSISFRVTDDADYVAVFEKTKGVVVGMPQTSNQYLPSYSYYKYTLSQQIYTPDEIGGSTPITGLSFFNAGKEKTRNYDIYLVHTDKTAFSSDADWIAVTESDRVFSGDVTMTSGYWTTIAFDTPFAYDGVSNLAIVVDDNSGNYTSAPQMSCRVFHTENTQAIRVYSDDTNYDPYNPSGYGGTRCSEKNQIVFQTSLTQTVTLSAGWNWFSTYLSGEPTELLQMLENSLGENGIVIKSNAVSTDYYEDYGWYGDLDDEGLKSSQMYMIKTNAACTVELEGVPANPAEVGITIRHGWNWIGFPCAEAMSVADALAGFQAEDGDILKSSGASTDYYEGFGWYGELETMEPGHGFMYYSNSQTTKTVYFQTGSKKDKKSIGNRDH